jgi:hypothetical protein
MSARATKQAAASIGTDETIQVPPIRTKSISDQGGAIADLKTVAVSGAP